MSVFTDDDLKLLKTSSKYWEPPWNTKIPALLLRLEAAENLILLRGTLIQMTTNTRKIETATYAWRKSKGE